MMTRLSRTALALSASILLAACSTAASPTPTESEFAATASPSEAATIVSPSAAASATADQAAVDAWRAHATQHRGMDGTQIEFDCPPDGELKTVWGTDVYTDDSSVCSAAVHAGVITLEEPGTVVIEIRPGEDSYEGSERNGVTSQPYPAWGGSFVIIDD